MIGAEWVAANVARTAAGDIQVADRRIFYCRSDRLDAQLDHHYVLHLVLSLLLEDRLDDRDLLDHVPSLFLFPGLCQVRRTGTDSHAWAHRDHKASVRVDHCHLPSSRSLILHPTSPHLHTDSHDPRHRPADSPNEVSVAAPSLFPSKVSSFHLEDPSIGFDSTSIVSSFSWPLPQPRRPTILARPPLSPRRKSWMRRIP